MEIESMNEFITVARAQDIPNQGGLAVRLGGQQIAIFRIEETYFAIENECPHKGAPLSQGTVAGGSIFCPFHGWEFHLKSGACVDCPTSPVRTFPVRVIDGQVQVQL